MAAEIEHIPSGGITSPGGFLAGAARAGIKENASCFDLGILASDKTCTAAGVFTTNRVKAAPVLLSQQRLLSSKARAVVINSGCANACTGEQGMADAVETARLASEKIGVSPEEVLVASTGVIGWRLPMVPVRRGISEIVLSKEGGHDLARAIMTTDTVPKEVAVKVKGADFTIGGMAKGSGMIHPDMATLLCFLTTDAAAEPAFLKRALRRAVDRSFNMVSVDGDTSTNDMALLMASGLARGVPVTPGSRAAGLFQEALDEVCVHLARAIARDGEGAGKLIEVIVRGAVSSIQARRAARTIAGSSLVKSAVYGNDPNWGRIMAAVGRSGVTMDEGRVEIFLGDSCLVLNGCALPFDMKDAAKLLDRPEVSISVDLNTGEAEATAWGCDLTEEYVKINSQYTT